MKKVILQIENCKNCPNVKIERYYTADSWETEFVWKCKKKGLKVIGYADWRPSDQARIEIPDWCPLSD